MMLHSSVTECFCRKADEMQAIEVDKTSCLPIYRQIADYLRNDIMSGRSELYDANGKLPSESEIARVFSTTRMTLRKALKILEKEGLLVQYQGKGTFVVRESQAVATSTKRIGFMGFMVAHAELSLYRTPVFMGIEHTLTKQFPTENIMLPISPLQSDFAERLQEIKAMNLDGIVLAVDLNQIPALLQSGLQDIPHVIVCNSNRELEKAGFNMLDVDNVQGISLVIDHLMSLGHSKIAFLGRKAVERFDTLMRLDAFRRVVVEAGLDEFDCPVVLSSADMEDSVERLLRDHKEVTAVVTPGYFLAIDVLRALRSRGVGVPEDISVTGFDYYSDTQQLFEPLITTIRTPVFDMGSKAGEMLWKQILNKPLERQTETMSVDLLVQETTAPARQV